MLILDLLKDIKHFMFEPDFDNCVDLERENHRAEMIEYQRKKAEAKTKSEEPPIPSIVQKWNEDNSKSSPEEWERDWLIEKNDQNLKMTAKALI